MMTLRQKTHEIIDRSADLGLRVFASSIKQLYINAAKAMFLLIAQKRKTPSTTQTKEKKFNISVSAQNKEELLVGWLSELLYLFDSKNIVFTKYSIKELTNKHIKAAAFAMPITKRNFVLQTEIKAVTYHDVKIRKTKNQYKAQIIFDT